MIIEIYTSIALSFALSSLFFLHRKGLKEQGVKKYPIVYDLAYVIATFVTFPFFVLNWAFKPTEFKIGYAKTLAGKMKEKGQCTTI